MRVSLRRPGAGAGYAPDLTPGGVGRVREELDRAPPLEVERSRRAEDEKGADQIRSSWDQLNSMLQEPLPDEKKLLAQADEISRLSSAFQERRLSVTYQVRALLSKEQLEQFTQLRSGARPPQTPGVGGRPPR